MQEITPLNFIYSYVVATYKDGNTLYAKYNLTEEEKAKLNGRTVKFVSTQITAQAGTPYSTPTTIATSTASNIKNNGYVDVYLCGTGGYVNGHGIGVYLAIAYA